MCSKFEGEWVVVILVEFFCESLVCGSVIVVCSVRAVEAVANDTSGVMVVRSCRFLEGHFVSTGGVGLPLMPTRVVGVIVELIQAVVVLFRVVESFLQLRSHVDEGAIHRLHFVAWEIKVRAFSWMRGQRVAAFSALVEQLLNFV